MATAHFNVDSTAAQRIIKKYGEDAVIRAANVVTTYTQKIKTDARQIITDLGHVNSGGLRSSINEKTKIAKGDIIGEINAGKLYARFIHEGVKHVSDSQIVPMFVSFDKAPSLLQWAIRKGVILQKTSTGKIKKGTWAKRDSVQKWVLAKSGKPINIKSGGLKVMIKPANYFSEPFNKHAPDFEKDIRKAVLE